MVSPALAQFFCDDRYLRVGRMSGMQAKKNFSLPRWRRVELAVKGLLDTFARDHEERWFQRNGIGVSQGEPRGDISLSSVGLELSGNTARYHGFTRFDLRPRHCQRHEHKDQGKEGFHFGETAISRRLIFRMSWPACFLFLQPACFRRWKPWSHHPTV